MTGPVYFVRLHQERGRGAYVHPMAHIDSGGNIMDGRLTTEQRRARRFYCRGMAQCYADAFGGRVVRLRERGR